MYRIARCPECGALQATSSAGKFLCKLCGAKRAMLSKGQRKVEIIVDNITAKQANELVRKLKEIEAKK